MNHFTPAAVTCMSSYGIMFAIRDAVAYAWCFLIATYQKLELEKKKSRVHRQTYYGPSIRFHSVTVSLSDDNVPDAEINVDTVDR